MIKINILAGLLIIALLPNTSRSQTCYNMPEISLSLVDNANGTITDKETSLVWKKCIEGAVWNVNTNTCDGSGIAYNWQAALQHTNDVNLGAVGQRHDQVNWRLPNIKELSSIVEVQCASPSINTSYFSSPSVYFWSSTGKGFFDASVFAVNFGYGGENMIRKTDLIYIRLVRNKY